MDGSEKDEYKFAIELDSDDLVIDGNGHCIDADCKAPIFNIASDNIVFKNIVFRNGFDEIGGAIKNSGFNVTILNSGFVSNTSKSIGGAIYNSGFLRIIDSAILNNESVGSGGAILNSGLLCMDGVFLSNNCSKENGGAISSSRDDELCIKNSIFSNNRCELKGGAIYISRGFRDVISTNDVGLYAGMETGGGVISPDDTHMNFKNCRFKNNEPHDIFEAYHHI